MAWDNATPEKQDRRIEAGTEAFGNMSTGKEYVTMNVDAEASDNLSSDRQDALRQLGRENCHLGAAGGDCNYI